MSALGNLITEAKQYLVKMGKELRFTYNLNTSFSRGLDLWMKENIKVLRYKIHKQELKNISDTMDVWDIAHSGEILGEVMAEPTLGEILIEPAVVTPAYPSQNAPQEPQVDISIESMVGHRPEVECDAEALDAIVRGGLPLVGEVFSKIHPLDVMEEIPEILPEVLLGTLGIPASPLAEIITQALEKSSEEVLADARLRWQKERQELEAAQKEEKQKLQADHKRVYAEFKKSIGTSW